MKIIHNLGNSQVAIEERPRPEPGPGEVLIKTVVSALCGSEMPTHHKAGQAAGNSGHEAAGVIAGLGEGVANLHIGQRVGASALAGCGHCDYCTKGQNTWCDSRKKYDAAAQRCRRAKSHIDRVLAANMAPSEFIDLDHVGEWNRSLPRDSWRRKAKCRR